MAPLLLESKVFGTLVAARQDAEAFSGGQPVARLPVVEALVAEGLKDSGRLGRRVAVQFHGERASVNHQVTGEGLASGGARGRDVRAVRSLGGRRCAGGCRRAGESGLRCGEFLFRGVSGESSELKDDGEHHGGGSRARSEKVVAFAPLLLLPPQLALCLHLLDPPLRFAGIA